MELGYKELSIRPGAHVALIYHDQNKGMAVVSSILAAGLKLGDGCLFCGPSDKAELLKDCLVDEGIDIKQALRKSHLELLSNKQQLLSEGVFDPDELISVLHGFVKETIEDEDKSARVVIDLDWLAEGVPGENRKAEFEAKAQEIFGVPDTPVIGLCMRSLKTIRTNELIKLLQLYSISIVGESVNINPFRSRDREIDNCKA